MCDFIHLRVYDFSSMSLYSVAHTWNIRIYCWCGCSKRKILRNPIDWRHFIHKIENTHGHILTTHTPILMIGGLPLWIYWRWRGKRRNRNNTSAEASFFLFSKNATFNFPSIIWETCALAKSHFFHFHYYCRIIRCWMLYSIDFDIANTYQCGIENFFTFFFLKKKSSSSSSFPLGVNR